MNKPAAVSVKKHNREAHYSFISKHHLWKVILVQTEYKKIKISSKY